jgi:P4 family phage/plasmid primase-like protien
MNINFKKYFLKCGEYIEKEYDTTYDDIFFIKSDIDKITSFSALTKEYKYCNKVYYYYNPSKSLWIEEKTNDSLYFRLCAHSVSLLNRDKTIIEDLFKVYGESTDLKRDDINELDEDIKTFKASWNKIYKSHQKATFARSIMEFINHQIMDNKFTDNININNQYVIPLTDCNFNFKFLNIEDRVKEQLFTECSKLKFKQFFKDGGGFNNLIKNEDYKIVDKFFLDICSGSNSKKNYLQKIFGSVLTGDTQRSRVFYIFYGLGSNGKSACIEVLQEIMGYFSKACPNSIILKRGKKSEGTASPEIAVLDYGTRLGLLSEIGDDEILNEEMLKRITGHDKIEYRPLYSKVKEFQCESNIIMITNNKPYFNLSPSMVDRIRYIEFKSRFIIKKENEALKENEYIRDVDLINNLKSIYLQYVLLWCAVGANQFYKDGHMNLPDDPALQLENMTYINECDSIGRFINEYCKIDPQAKVLKSHVFIAYKKFIEDEHIPKALTKGKFNENIEKFFKCVKGEGGNFYYNGFTLYDVNDEPKPNTNGLDD